MDACAPRQLALGLPAKITLDEENFLLHSGVRDAFASILTGASTSQFFIAYLEGAPRSGKSHTLVALACNLAAQGSDILFLEGDAFSDWLSRSEIDYEPHARSVLIVDDIDVYLSTVPAGESGAFVALVEKLRVAGAALLLGSTFRIDDFSCDAHIKSRLYPGQGFFLFPPSEEEGAEVALLLAHQRGIALDSKKAQYVVQRVGRSFGALETYFYRLEQMSAEMGSSIRFPLIHKSLKQ